MPFTEKTACTPLPLDPAGFNQNAVIPFGCTVKHIQSAMQEFTDFLGFLNGQMNTRKLPRLETMLMPANFSSIVGEFMSSTIPKHCAGLVKNRYHNGHPDLIPSKRFDGDMCQHGSDGIEIKGSRYLKAWQGHNPEDTWLMVFVFDSNRPVDEGKGVPLKPFSFRMVVGAELTKDDWLFAGRSETSRRTITASITNSGLQKMMNNWIYKDAALRAGAPVPVAD
ncbi:MAG: hypothetical protein NTX13_10985 [Acidobacteria bacterium]|nr:hypothetical protein [Acidobacteriota bacterium]